MRFSSLVDRIGGEGAAAWDIHSKAMAASTRGEDVLVMSIGDPDFATPDFIIEAGVEALRAGDTHYTGIAGRSELRTLIAQVHQQRSGVETTVDNVVILSGAQCGLYASAQCLAGHGDEVIILDPCYVTYEATIRACGAEIVRAMPRNNDSFRPDLAAIAAAITPHTRAIFFATPNNPTGVVYDQQELIGIARLAQQHDLWVVADEVYADLVFDSAHHSIAGIPGMVERTVTVSSLSKSHAMTGWRCGWVVAPPVLIDHLRNLALCMLYGLPGFIQQGGIIALREGADDVARMCDVYRQRRDLVVDLLQQHLGDVCHRPQAGMFLLLDVRATGMGSGPFCRALYESERVSLLDASAFGASAEGFVRLSFTLGEKQLTEGCQRIIRFMQRHQQ